MRSYLFSPDISTKSSNSLKTVHTVFIKYSSQSTPKVAPVCVISSKSYDSDLRNSQNKPKKNIFSKTVHTIRIKFLVILHHIGFIYRNRKTGI